MSKRMIIFIFLVSAMVLASTVGYSAGKKIPKTKITIMTSMFAPEPVRADHPIIKQIEEYTNTDLEFLWVPDSSINEKFSVMLAGNSLPDVVQVGTPFKANARAAFKAGAFWEVGPYLKSYNNLSKADPGLLQRVSVDGRLYCLPKERVIPRIGVIYRKDWANKLGFTKPPETIDEFYNLCKAFTLGDPDGNGRNDTLGLADQSSMSTFYSLAAWFDAGNEFIYKDGKVLPWFMSQGYMDAIKFYRKLYDEGLINKDFITFRAKAEALIGGKAGMTIGAMDDANKYQQQIAVVTPTAVLDVFSLVDTGRGFHVRAENPGFKGVFAFPKSAVRDKTKLKAILGFFDKLNDKKMNNLLEYGIEGINYDLIDGKAQATVERGEKNGIKRTEIADLSQLRTFRYSINPVIPPLTTPLQGKILKMLDDNLKYCVFNATDGLYSETYTMKEAELKKIRDDAQVKFIMGLFDEKALKAEFDRWMRAGGDKVVREFTAAYNAVHRKKK